MMKRTHMFTGIIATVPFINLDNALIAPIALIGSIAADWDFYMGIKHRTSTHSLLALLITSGAFMLFNFQLGLLWGLNYLTHLFLDSLTKMGVPLLYPFSRKYYGARIFKTRGAEDLLICLMFLYLITTIIQ